MPAISRNRSTAGFISLGAVLAILAMLGLHYTGLLDKYCVDTQPTERRFVDTQPTERRFEGKNIAGGKSPENPYAKEYIFTHKYFPWVVPVWKRVFEPFKGKPNIHYLEIGILEGGSMIWMLENILTHPTARVTGIDPFLREGTEQIFLSNLKLTGASEKVTLLKGFSQEKLRELPLNAFDIIYIDGSHKADDVLEDAVLSWRLLKEEGLIIFDDYLWAMTAPWEQRPKKAIDIFYEFYGNHFDELHSTYQVILKKRKAQ